MAKQYNILEVCVELNGGGIDRYLYNYCTRIPQIHFDIVVLDRDKEGILEKPIRDAGCQIFFIPRLRNGLLQNYLSLRKIFKSKKYDAVHVHLGVYSFLGLACAKFNGVKARIAHAHIANEPETIKNKIIRKVGSLLTRLFATNLAACGVDAAKWVWGEKCYNSGHVTIHNNAIDTSKYKFSLDKRQLLRKSFGINDNTIVVGHVGRLCEQKNQKRLLQIFNTLYDINSDVLLVLVGAENNDYDIKNDIKNLKNPNAVLFLGVRDDVSELINIMDVFVFPSQYEGLPFTLIETQCNGLYSICSDAISIHSKVSSNIEFLPLSCPDSIWVQRIIQSANKERSTGAVKDVIMAGYDLNVEANRLYRYYTTIIERVR